MGINHSFEPGFRNSTLAPKYWASCSWAASTTAWMFASSSVIPGSNGAIITPAEIPFSTRYCMASILAMGFGVPGSIIFHTFSLMVPILKLTWTSATSLSSASMSTSRRTKTPLVVMDAGF